jgi:hypothetical protein
MGLFDWLKRDDGNVEIGEDRVWITAEAKLAGIASQVLDADKRANKPFATILVAHFANVLQQLQTLIEDGQSGDNRVLVALAETLDPRAAPLTHFEQSGWLQIVVAERHPLRSHDEAIIEFARTLPCRCRVVRHLSLDDPVVRIFAGDSVKQLLGRLGMSEDEAIESRMVSRRILDAVKKIEQRAAGDLPAGSAEEWLQLNCPKS